MPSWLHDLAQPGILVEVAIIWFILWLMAKSASKALLTISKFVSRANTLVGTIGIGMAASRDYEAGELAEVYERACSWVENDHVTNFREYEDAMMSDLKDLTKEVREHVAISRAKDKQADETACRAASLAD